MCVCPQAFNATYLLRFGVYDGLDPRCRYQKARSQKTHDRSTNLLDDDDDDDDLEWGVLRELERL